MYLLTQEQTYMLPSYLFLPQILFVIIVCGSSVFTVFVCVFVCDPVFLRDRLCGFVYVTVCLYDQGIQ